MGLGKGLVCPTLQHELQDPPGEKKRVRTENKQGHGCCGFGGIFLPSHLPLGPAAPLPPPLDVAEVEISLLYPPVGGDLLWFVALHVLLHGGEAGAVLQADGALVGGSAIVGPKVFDHGRVVPGALVAQLALEGLLACGTQRHRAVTGGSGPPGTTQLPVTDTATVAEPTAKSRTAELTGLWIPHLHQPAHPGPRYPWLPPCSPCQHFCQGSGLAVPASPLPPQHVPVCTR